MSLIFYSFSSSRKLVLTPFWAVPQQIIDLHPVALFSESHSFLSWSAVWASLSSYIMCTPPLKSLQASDGNPAFMSAYEPHTLRETIKKYLCKLLSVVVFYALILGFLPQLWPTSVLYAGEWVVRTLHKLSPAKEPKTHFHLWTAQTVNACWVLAGSRQWQHPPTFQTSRTDTEGTRRNYKLDDGQNVLLKHRLNALMYCISLPWSEISLHTPRRTGPWEQLAPSGFYGVSVRK